MTNILTYIFASAYSGAFASYGAAVATCKVNGEIVNCPSWLSGGAFSTINIFAYAISILVIVSLWKIFLKAGKPGWASIVPIYNTVVLLEVTKKPAWWVVLWFVPFVNIVISIIVLYNLALAFGKGGGFTLGLVLLPFIFYPILAFDKSTYTPKNQPIAPTATPPQPAV